MSGVVSRPKHDFVFDKHQFRKSNFQLKILDNCHHNESVFISDLDVRFGTNLVDKYQANTFFFEFFSRKFWDLSELFPARSRREMRQDW